MDPFFIAAAWIILGIITICISEATGIAPMSFAGDSFMFGVDFIGRIMVWPLIASALLVSAIGAAARGVINWIDSPGH